MKYFEKLAGTEEKAKPLLDVYANIKDKSQNQGKMDELLKKMVELMSSVELPTENISQLVTSRYLEAQTPVLKTVKDAMPAGNNDFRKQRTQKPQGNYK